MELKRQCNHCLFGFVALQNISCLRVAVHFGEKMIRRTKIVSTLGPASDEPGVLERLIVAGVNVVRLNFSHGSPEDHLQRCQLVRELAAKHNVYVAVLGDLQGA